MIEIRVRTEEERDFVMGLQAEDSLSEMFGARGYIIRFDHGDHVSTVGGGGRSNTVIAVASGGMSAGGGGGTGGNTVISDVWRGGRDR
jgi:hypothetical protein